MNQNTNNKYISLFIDFLISTPEEKKQLLNGYKNDPTIKNLLSEIPRDMINQYDPEVQPELKKLVTVLRNASIEDVSILQIIQDIYNKATEALTNEITKLFNTEQKERFAKLKDLGTTQVALFTLMAVIYYNKTKKTIGERFAELLRQNINAFLKTSQTTINITSLLASLPSKYSKDIADSINEFDFVGTWYKLNKLSKTKHGSKL